MTLSYIYTSGSNHIPNKAFSRPFSHFEGKLGLIFLPDIVLINILTLESGNEISDNFLQLGISVWGDESLLGNAGEDVLVTGLDHGHKLLLKLGDLGWVHLVQVATHAAVDDGHLLLDGHWH